MSVDSRSSGQRKAPKQERSREMVAKIVAATVALLRYVGPDQITTNAIAEKAARILPERVRGEEGRDDVGVLDVPEAERMAGQFTSLLVAVGTLAAGPWVLWGLLLYPLQMVKLWLMVPYPKPVRAW